MAGRNENQTWRHQHQKLFLPGVQPIKTPGGVWLGLAEGIFGTKKTRSPTI